MLQSHRGFTAEIYAWKEGWILKLFNQGISRAAVEHEANKTRIVHATGLPVPAVGEIIEIEDRYGMELERVDGISMLDALTKSPWKYPALARQLAELHAEMHTRRVPELPALSETLARKINRAEKLPENVRQAALKALEQLPEDDRLCHGDFHPGNILLSGRGPVIIDWIDCSRGRPILDVATIVTIVWGRQYSLQYPREQGYYEFYKAASTASTNGDIFSLTQSIDRSLNAGCRWWQLEG